MYPPQSGPGNQGSDPQAPVFYRQAPVGAQQDGPQGAPLPPPYEPTGAPYAPGPAGSPYGQPLYAPAQAGRRQAPPGAQGYGQPVPPGPQPIQRPYPQQPIPFRAPPAPRKYTAVYVILAVLVVTLGGMALSRLLNTESRRTAYVTRGTLGANYTGDALIVRNETVFAQQGVSRIEYIAQEGAAVSRGDIVCNVYTSGFSTKELTTLQNYRNQIKEYHKTLLAASTTVDTKLSHLETEVLDRARETRALVQGAKGNLLNQEVLLAKAMSSRQYYLKQKYPDDQKLSRLYDDEKSQLQRIETWTKQYPAVDKGIVSFYTDGYEKSLNVLTYADYTPAEVRAMYEETKPGTEALGRNEVPIYRLVRQYSWSVLMLCDDPAWTPTIGARYELLVESFDSTKVQATVESITRSGGELLIRLAVNTAVDSILYIRNCHVQLSENIISLTVPAAALFSQGGQQGVVVSQPEGEYFVPVTVISQDSVLAHIVPVSEGYLYEGLRVLLF